MSANHPEFDPPILSQGYELPGPPGGDKFANDILAVTKDLFASVIALDDSNRPATRRNVIYTTPSGVKVQRTSECSAVDYGLYFTNLLSHNSIYDEVAVLHMVDNDTTNLSFRNPFGTEPGEASIKWHPTWGAELWSTEVGDFFTLTPSNVRFRAYDDIFQTYDDLISDPRKADFVKELVGSLGVAQAAAHDALTPSRKLTDKLDTFTMNRGEIHPDLYDPKGQASPQPIAWANRQITNLHDWLMERAFYTRHR